MKHLALALLVFAAALPARGGFAVYHGRAGDSLYFELAEADDWPLLARWNVHERVAHVIRLDRRPFMMAMEAPWFAYVTRERELSVFSFDEEGAIIPRGAIVTRHSPGLIHVARDRAGADWLIVFSHDGDNAYLEAFRAAGPRRWLARGEMLRSWMFVPHAIGSDAILAGRAIFSARRDPVAIMPDTGMDVIDVYPAANVAVRENDWYVRGPDGERIAVPWNAKAIPGLVRADVPMASWSADGIAYVTRFDVCGWRTVLSLPQRDLAFIGDGFAPAGDAWVVYGSYGEGVLRIGWIENAAFMPLSLPLR